MKKSTYMSSNELVDFCKIGILAGEADAISKITTDEHWKELLAEAAKNCMTVINERLAALSKDQLQTVVRRRKNSKMVMQTVDETRMRFSQEKKLEDVVKVNIDDLYDLADLAVCSCCACPQGENVKNCYYRKVFHNLGMAVVRDEPLDGECEFSWLPVGETEQLKPHYQKLEDPDD